jgi:hypothetical protein
MSTTIDCGKLTCVSEKFTRPTLQPSLFGDHSPPATTGCTSCVSAIIGYYSSIGSSLKSADVRGRAVQDGFAQTTVARSIAKLVDHGTLRYSHGGLVLTDVEPPRDGLYSNELTAAMKRFGNQPDTEIAEFVRSYYSDRLDELFETPTSELTKVLRAVSLAGKIARSMQGGSMQAAKQAACDLNELVEESFPSGLSECTLLDALNAGLFPEDYRDDPEFAESIKKHRQAADAERSRLILETIRQNEEIAAENADRIEMGQRKKPFIELPTALFDGRTKDFLDGLVPLGGGERMGSVRLEAWKRVVQC